MIEIQSLIKKFGNLVAVDSVSLLIESGSFFGLVGPNGAGKTTIVNILSGIIRPTSGDVRLFGLDIRQDGLEVKQQIGVVPEGMALFGGLTGEEYLTFVGRIYKIPIDECQKRVTELLEAFELLGAGRQLIDTYSQGMKKKLSFAAAVMHKPKILFLDEPFENVDPIQRKFMKEVLQLMQNRGATIFLTSHVLETVEALCDNVAILNKGKLVFQAKTTEIRRTLKNELSQETYQSLEEIFLDVVSDREQKTPPRRLSWL
jgi:ABC-2 type transport system ATP-binding protein